MWTHSFVGGSRGWRPLPLVIGLLSLRQTLHPVAVHFSLVRERSCRRPQGRPRRKISTERGSVRLPHYGSHCLAASWLAAFHSPLPGMGSWPTLPLIVDRSGVRRSHPRRWMHLLWLSHVIVLLATAGRVTVADPLHGEPQRSRAPALPTPHQGGFHPWDQPLPSTTPCPSSQPPTRHGDASRRLPVAAARAVAGPPHVSPARPSTAPRRLRPVPVGRQGVLTHRLTVPTRRPTGPAGRLTRVPAAPTRPPRPPTPTRRPSRTPRPTRRPTRTPRPTRRPTRTPRPSRRPNIPPRRRDGSTGASSSGLSTGEVVAIVLAVVVGVALLAATVWWCRRRG